MGSKALALACTTALILGCGKGNSSGGSASGSAPSGDTTATGDSMVKLSEYGMAEYCSVAQSPDGTIHAIYTDATTSGKPHYVYYRASHDAGATWTEAKNLSDDESGIGAAYCRLLVGNGGKLYAVWKYLDSNNLDGPGGEGSGMLAWRVMDGGNWTPISRLGDKHHPMTSWFAALSPDGKVNVVWSQGNIDVDWQPMGGVSQWSANILHQTVLDGTSPQTHDLITPKPVPTREQIDEAHKAGHDYSFEDQNAHQDGLFDLRGYIDSSGQAHCIGELGERRDNPNGEMIMLWNGSKLSLLYNYERFKAGNTFNNPPELLTDAAGKECMIRMPEEGKTERPVVRQYAVVNGQIGDHNDVIAPQNVKGSITAWQANHLSDGRIAVTASVSEKGGWAPDDVDLMLVLSDGHGGWTKPVNVTDNAGRAKSFSNAAAAQSTTYTPTYAQSALLTDGSIGVVTVDQAYTVSGVNQVGVTGSGRAVTGMMSFSTRAPYVFFKKVKAGS